MRRPKRSQPRSKVFLPGARVENRRRQPERLEGMVLPRIQCVVSEDPTGIEILLLFFKLIFGSEALVKSAVMVRVTVKTLTYPLNQELGDGANFLRSQRGDAANGNG